MKSEVLAASFPLQGPSEKGRQGDSVCFGLMWRAVGFGEGEQMQE